MFLDVGDGYEIFYEIVGNPAGIPLVVLHGGPGAATSNYRDRLLTLFDLRKWRVLLWDQRGCGKSRVPKVPLQHNTTWDLVDDMERLRRVMGVDRWTLFGGSWGTTLALAYVSKHLDCVAGLLLRGVSLLAPWETEWLYGPSGVARLFPEGYARFVGDLKGMRKRMNGRTVTRSYSRLLKNKRTHRVAADRWCNWEFSLSSLNGQKRTRNKRNTKKSVSEMATLENHYFLHNAWLTADQLLAAARRIPVTVPVFIVQGRYDLICPPAAAIALARAVPHSRIRLTVAGHSWTDPENLEGLKEGLRRLQPSQLLQLQQ